MVRRLSIGLCIATALIPVVAEAKRPATRAEKRAVLEEFGTPLRCSKVAVSTVNSRWASSRFNWKRYRTCRRYAGDGMNFHKKTNGKWRSVTGMSDCPSRLGDVPRKVYRDLSRDYCNNRYQT